MKKSVILMILVVYVLGIIVVGVLGLAMKVYNENIYVESIECLTKGYVVNERNPEVYDGYISVKYEEGLKVNLNCIAKPDDATYKKLEYRGEVHSEVYRIELRDDGSADIIFLRSGLANIIVKATDTEGKSITIRINATNLDDIL